MREIYFMFQDGHIFIQAAPLPIQLNEDDTKSIVPSGIYRARIPKLRKLRVLAAQACQYYKIAGQGKGNGVNLIHEAMFDVDKARSIDLASTERREDPDEEMRERQFFYFNSQQEENNPSELLPEMQLPLPWLGQDIK